MNIYTHAGRFHADEVTAYTILSMCFSNLELHRLDDIDNLGTDGIVIDIGRRWDPENCKFDHHQGYFQRPNGIPYASAGMVWDHYARMAIASVLGDSQVETVYYSIKEKVDKGFIQGIDAHDAANTYRVEGYVGDDSVSVMTLSEMIAHLNCTDVFDHKAQMEYFYGSVMLIKRIIREKISQAYAQVKAVRYLKEEATHLGESKVIVLPELIRWKKAVHDNYPQALFVIMPSSHPGSSFSMLAVPVNPNSREVKIPIERLDGFEGFIHQGRWIAGSDSVDDLIKLAKSNINERRRFSE